MFTSVNIKVLELFLTSSCFKVFLDAILPVYCSPMSHIWDKVSALSIFGSINNAKLLDLTLISC